MRLPHNIETAVTTRMGTVPIIMGIHPHLRESIAMNNQYLVVALILTLTGTEVLADNSTLDAAIGGGLHLYASHLTGRRVVRVVILQKIRSSISAPTWAGRGISGARP